MVFVIDELSTADFFDAAGRDGEGGALVALKTALPDSAAFLAFGEPHSTPSLRYSDALLTLLQEHTRLVHVDGDSGEPLPALAAHTTLVVRYTRAAYASLSAWAQTVAAHVDSLGAPADAVAVLLADRATVATEAHTLRRRAVRGIPLLVDANGTTPTPGGNPSTNLAPPGMFDAILAAFLVFAIIACGFCQLGVLQTPTEFAMPPRKLKSA
eukprot:TRINITY_DN945_c0_g1_i1.p2 TRINITY_DN945_c0_g1~~TRINITY_DN945_c0_g1_i1.p2  ORF type:complete len:212 (+),score=111.53 TRINITY_DN945_c0_g1_i1:60-695(+)